MKLFRKSSGKKPRFRILVGVIIVALIAGVVWTLLNPTASDASWFDDSYHYRTAYSFTHNAALTDRRLDITIDTATLISAGKMQSDCDDSRFTDINGKVLRYQLVASCNNASTSYSIVIPTVNNGLNSYYFYYGNQTAVSNSDTTVASVTSVTPSGGAPSGATEEKGPAPVLYWKFDEGTGTTANDSGANNNSGTITVPLWQVESECSIGKCLKYDAANNYVSRAFSSDTELNPGTGSLTVSAWIKHDTSIGGTDVIISRYSSGGYILYMNSSGYVCFGIDDDGTSFPEDSACSSTGYADAKWHFVEGVKSGTSSVTLYIDGKQIDQDTSISSTGSISGSSPTLYVGAEGPATNNWEGLIDEVKIFDYAKTASQVKADYSARGTVDAASATFGGADAVTAMLAKDLKGYWKMDESAANSCIGGTNDNCDSSGNRYDLNFTNDATFGPGKFGNGVVLDGNDDSTQRGGGLFTGITGSKRWTVATWFKSLSDTQGYIFDTRGADGAALYTDGTDVIKLYYFNSNSVKDISYDASITNNNWHHAVMSRDEDNHISVYVDGKKLTPSATTTDDNISSLSDTWGNIFFGHRHSGNIYPLNGTIDEGRVYNRAFSESEVQTLYDWAPGPLGYWKMDENTGSTFSDYSGNGNSATWNGTGSPSWQQGKYGASVLFNGTDNYLDSTPSKTGRGFVTIEGWVNFNNPDNLNNVDDYHTLIGWSAEYKITFRSYTSEPGAGYFIQVVGTSISSGTNGIDFQYPLPTKITGWHHLAATYDGAISKLFIDGNFVDSVSYADTAGIKDNGRSFRIGGDTETGQYFDGQIDEVRYYNYPRTQKQIISDMNGGHPNVGSPVGSAIGHWKFDEGQGTTANNSGSLGTTLNGTISNMSSPGTSTSGWSNAGKFGKALIFDNDNDVINMGSDSSIDNLAALSVSAWIKPVSSGESNVGRIIDKTTGPNTVGWALLMDSNNLNFSVNYGTSPLTVITSATLPASTWSYVTATWDGTSNANGVSIYINGKKQTSFTQNDSGVGSRNNDAAANLFIGNETGGTRTFDGAIDEVKIYNYVLSDSEVLLDMNQGKSQVLGSLATASDGITNDNSNSREYCVPGDTTSCSAPIAEWKFDENTGTIANDISGNANTGTFTNGPTWANLGKHGSGVQLDGVNDYIDTGSNSVLDDLSAKTIEAWIYPTGNGGQAIVDKESTGWYYFKIPSGTRLLEYEQNFTTLRGNWTTSTNVITLNAWNHVAVTYNKSSASNVPIIYVNGQSKALDTNHIPSGTAQTEASGNLIIGNFADAGTPFSGVIDDFRIYNYIRTPAQIAWDFNRGGPVAWYKLDECSGNTANDSSGFANNATISIGGSGTYTSAGACNSGTSTDAWNAGSTGKYSAALGFDGTNDVASTSNVSMISPDGVAVSGISFGAWVKPSSLAATNTVIQKSNEMRLNINTSGFATCEISSGGLLRGPATSSVAIGTSSWSHVFCTFDSTTIKVFVNGKLSGTSSYSGSVQGSSSNSFYIGQDSSGSTFMNGLIDDVRYYNYALTQVQINGLINENSSTRFGP